MKGINLRIKELQDNLLSVINEAKLPVSVTTIVLSGILDTMKDAESTMIILEKQAYEKELAEKEGAKDEEIH
jgi:hypothetical protein